MQKHKAYQKLLKQMLLIENAGEIIYQALNLKDKESNLRLVYERLALNERQTAGYIEKEILAIDKNQRVLVNGIILSLVKFICIILTARQLAWILKSALKKRVYSRWYNIYKDENQDFWSLLLSHENLQRELLQGIPE